ncbi:MAG: RND transporter, partial [Clostridia bacterium]|nr:RND transporter [Clostridia bacterium]
TNEQAQKVRVGDSADVVNYYWGPEIKATLTSIVNDPQSQGKSKILVFNLSGDVSSGQNLTLSIGQKSANYDSIVPTSAIRSDTNGNFVLVITAKSTPLGNRYTATRVDVTILAQDDTQSAVSGLSYGDFVITNSSKPVEAGMQVNLVENP